MAVVELGSKVEGAVLVFRHHYPRVGCSGPRRLAVLDAKEKKTVHDRKAGIVWRMFWPQGLSCVRGIIVSSRSSSALFQLDSGPFLPSFINKQLRGRNRKTKVEASTSQVIHLL